jgi:succinoglycan biosynthesis transport protein ExoP
VPQIDNPQLISANGPQFPALPTLAERIDFVLGFLRRRYLIILVCLLLSLPVAGVYLYTTPPTYTASAVMMIETRKGPLESLLAITPFDPVWIESQVGVLKSQSVAAYVVKHLRLADDRQFLRPEGGLPDKLFASLGWGPSEPKSEAERVGEAIGTVLGGLDVKRVGQSYMMRIDFRSQNPEHAVKVANAMIEGYIFDQLNAKYQANRRGGDWLQERLQTLREQAAAAERAVLEFKAKNNIVAVGPTLMNEKQLSEISGQLAMARSQTSDLQIRLNRIRAVREAYQQEKPAAAADESITEAMSNGIISGLRTQYLSLVNREADWSVRYGKNHTAVANLRNQIRDLRRSIHDELGRIEETAKSEGEIAKKRQDDLDKALVTLISQSSETNQAKVTLFSLEAAAQSYRKLYDNFLQRHTETLQQQTFPISDARSISPASVRQTAPKPAVVWTLTIFAGGMLGVGLGAFREIMDRRFRTGEQVRSVLATECLALVPLLTEGQMRVGSVADRIAPRSICSAPKIMRTVAESPLSPYAEAIRSIKLTVDQNSNRAAQQYSSKVIGLTSCLPSEGKSTLAAAMAALIAQRGDRVILLDCDLRHPSLSRALAPDASAGFLDVIAGKIELEDAVWNDPITNMAFLPAGATSDVSAADILASDAAKQLFGMLQIKFDYVIVDLAPLGVGVDVRATSGLIDSYILVIEWGATKIDSVQKALRDAPNVQANIVGAVLNKVNMAVMKRYVNYGASYHYGQPPGRGAVN